MENNNKKLEFKIYYIKDVNDWAKIEFHKDILIKISTTYPGKLRKNLIPNINIKTMSINIPNVTILNNLNKDLISNLSEGLISNLSKGLVSYIKKYLK